MAGAVVLVGVLAAAGFAVYDQRHSFVSSIHKMGPWALVGSVAIGLVGVGVQVAVWTQVLKGLGAEIPLGEASGIYFVSQLGKYFPGSVWPAVMQMEAGYRRGFNRRTVLGANLVALAISCATGLLVAAGLLSSYDRAALDHYWWGLLALPLLLALLHPRSLPALLDWAFARLHRPPLDDRLGVRSEVTAALLCLVGWVGLGSSLIPLVASEGRSGLSTVLLCIGAMSLAVPLGILFIPAPAGAGIREVVLTLILKSILTTGQALAVVIASRAVLVVCDMLLAAAGALVQRYVTSRALPAS